MASYRVTVSAGKCLRLDHLYDPAHDVHAQMGHYWWFWLPNYYSNGGSIRRGSAVCDHNFKWLCFWVAVTFWRTK